MTDGAVPRPTVLLCAPGSAALAAELGRAAGAQVLVCADADAGRALLAATTPDAVVVAVADADPGGLALLVRARSLFPTASRIAIGGDAHARRRARDEGGACLALVSPVVDEEQSGLSRRKPPAGMVRCLCPLSGQVCAGHAG